MTITTNTTEEIQKIKIFMNYDLCMRIKILTSYSHELAGFFIGTIDEEGFHIEELLLPPQEVSGAEVTLDTDAIQWLLKNHSDKVKNIIGHWHSHNSMSAFFSAGDHNNHKELMKGRTHFLFMVTAQSSEKLFDYSSIVLLNKPFTYTLPAQVSFQYNGIEEMEKIIDEEVQSKITKKAFNFNISNVSNNLPPNFSYQTNIYRNDKFDRFNDCDEIDDMLAKQEQELEKEGYNPSNAFTLNLDFLTLEELNKIKDTLSSLIYKSKVTYKVDEYINDRSEQTFALDIFCNSNKTKKHLFRALMEFTSERCFL